MTSTTWGEFKRIVEALPEVTENTRIAYFDTGALPDEVRAYLDRDGLLVVVGD